MNAVNGNRSHVPAPPRSGENVAGGRMGGLTGLFSNEAEEQRNVTDRICRWKTSKPELASTVQTCRDSSAVQDLQRSIL